MSILQRTYAFGDRKPGWRLVLPVWGWRRTDFGVHVDAIVTGWWWFILGFAVAPIGQRRTHGLSFRLTWGWTTDAQP